MRAVSPQPTSRNPADAKWWSKANASPMRARFMIVKLVASTAESLCRPPRRKYSQDCSRSRSSQGRMRAVPGLLALATELASSLASRQGRLRSYIVRFMLGFVSVLYRAHETLVIALAGVLTFSNVLQS